MYELAPEQRKWTVDDHRVLDAAARRVARGQGVKGFGNARDCRKAAERAYQVTHYNPIAITIIVYLFFLVDLRLRNIGCFAQARPQSMLSSG